MEDQRRTDLLILDELSSIRIEQESARKELADFKQTVDERLAPFDNVSGFVKVSAYIVGGVISLSAFTAAMLYFKNLLHISLK